MVNMKTPIIDFVKDYVNQNNLRLHMPGHKGKNILGFEEFDITEISGADVLYSPEGIIKQSEAEAAALFETKKTVYSAEGSSLSIRAMLYLVKTYAEFKKEKPFILSGRNAHKTFVTAAALLDIDVEWMMGENSSNLLTCNITAEFLEKKLSCSQIKPTAVYITSPDYLGNTLDIADISAVCRKYGVLLLVDNAHGAYLKFLPQSYHPIDLGADLCCDSAHKTLPVLTGGGYLHISKKAPQFFCDFADNAMSLFASTSPSYLILQSLDLANAYMAEEYREQLVCLIPQIEALKKELKSRGFQIFGNEPLKLTIAPKSYGYTGDELSDFLAERGIICEFSDPDFNVIMLTPQTGEEGIEKLRLALSDIEEKDSITVFPPRPVLGIRKLTLNQAIFSPFEEIAVENASGRVLASPTVSCPPAVPIVICGEEITQSSVETFKYYGIKKCFVVKKESEKGQN